LLNTPQGLADDVADDSITEHFAKAGPILKVNSTVAGLGPVDQPLTSFLFICSGSAQDCVTVYFP
jgi:hypothetical protein